MTTEEQVQQGDGASEEVEEHFPQFVISQEQALSMGRSLPLMIIGRMSYTDRQAFEQELQPDADIKELLKVVTDSSSKDPDFLLPDTPLKEAIFRVILGNGNEAMTAEDISELLSERWAMTAYPRDVSPQVIQRLLENSYSYGIVRVPDPEEEEEELLDEIMEEPVAVLEQGDDDSGDAVEEEEDAAEESDEEESED